jgi:hypothetical protein
MRRPSLRVTPHRGSSMQPAASDVRGRSLSWKAVGVVMALLAVARSRGRSHPAQVPVVTSPAQPAISPFPFTSPTDLSDVPDRDASTAKTPAIDASLSKDQGRRGVSGVSLDGLNANSNRAPHGPSDAYIAVAVDRKNVACSSTGNGLSAIGVYAGNRNSPRDTQAPAPRIALHHQ